ncbi:hypothetical protein [Pontibacter sp. SGAir0037]|uniref:hypothetical protein n=1 Tax=Pontibacter sp. SGAir0037 TaxID=2571030 RepID=UPI0010F86255|nr:hypothetical protein [Pontibacter sp. SGAir0037]
MRSETAISPSTKSCCNDSHHRRSHYQTLLHHLQQRISQEADPVKRKELEAEAAHCEFEMEMS